MEQPGDIIDIRKDKIRDLKQSGIDLYPNDFTVTHTVKNIQLAVVNQDMVVAAEIAAIKTAGRIMAINRFGKSAFIRFKDRTGQMQAYVRQDRVGNDAYALFKQMDIGDFVGMTGSMFQTKTGEWTLLADSVKLLSKAIRPLPEKFHGLKDPEKRYRQRYLDLIINPEVSRDFHPAKQIGSIHSEFFD